MAEYIEREAALAFQNEVEPLLCRNVVTHDIMSATKDADMVKYLQSIPAADVRPVVRGKWIMNDESRTVCSLCGNVVAFVSHPDRRWDFGNFCPNCGAKMEES